MMALGLTLFVLMEFMFPKPKTAAPVPATNTAHADRRAAVTAPAAVAADVPAEAREFNPAGDYQIVVTVGEEGPGKHGYQATFSTVGGGLSSYSLLGFYRVPQDESPENRVLLLDRLEQGHDSLRVDNVSYGPALSSLVRTPMNTARYELVEIPASAVVTPEPEGVVVGDKLVMRTIVGTWEILRTYRFNSADFTMEFDVEWKNIAGAANFLNYSLVGPAGIIPDDDTSQFSVINFLSARQPNPNSVTVEVERNPLPNLVKAEGRIARDNRANLAWIGAKNRFFTTIMTTSSATLTDSNGAARLLYISDSRMLPGAKDIRENLKTQPELPVVREGRDPETVPLIGETSLTVEPGLVNPGETYKGSYKLYAGPAVDEYMEKADSRLHGVLSYTISYLDFISRWLVKLLNILNGVFHNYGIAIIAVTIIIKALLHPLNRKSFISMNKMSKLAPKMKEIQQKYSSDRVKMQQEMSKFYKENGVSMAGGCLPIFLQLPIFFALYGAFSQGFSMRHAPFLSPWIKDLSKPDMIADFGWKIPLLNSSYLSLLPILYLVLQFFQMSMQPKPSDPQQAQQQKMMKYMPIIFVFFFYAMPAGLVLYFTVSALTGVLESWYMRKVVLPKLGLGDTPAAAQAAAASAAPGAGAAIVPSESKKKKKK